MKKLFSILLFLLPICTSAQTFYEANFVDPDDGEEYTALMIYYDDEHCKVRIITDEMLSENKVAESNYVKGIDDKKGKDDVGVMTYCPEDEGFPVFMWMWEKDDASDISEKPYCTFDPNDVDKYFEVNYFTEISFSDMDKEYIKQFYSEDEKEYQMLLQGLKRRRPNKITVVEQGQTQQTTPTTPQITPAETPVSTEKSTLHMLLVANTEVSDIGVACRRDLNNLHGEFSAIANVLGMDYNEITVADQNYNKANVVKMVKGIKTNPNDVLMFVYTGHGFRFDNQKDYYPNIDLRATNYDDPMKSYAAMSDIYNELAGKGARLTIVLSDCCNTKAGMDAPMTNVNSLFSRNNSNYDIEKLQKLFLGTSGQVRATASSPGEMSWCGVNGGFFILSFLESLRSQISLLRAEAPSWENLINNTISSAKKKSTSSASTKAQNGLKSVQIKAVDFNAPTKVVSDGNNVEPGTGGSTLDM